MGYVISYLIFPGLVFTAIVGLLTTWIDRKVTARVQWRVGPPWYQPFADFLKLLTIKETIIPQNSKRTGFLLAPLIGLAGITLASTILWQTNFNKQGFIGDLIVIVYLLILPSLAVIIGGSASGNPLGAVGASREMTLILAYELPFIGALLVPIIKSNEIQLGKIIEYQLGNGSIIASGSGIIAFIVALLCIQAKLGYIPFDIPEAETEITSGPYIDYSGPPLAIFKLTKAMMFFTLPVFLITLLWGGITITPLGIIYFILKYVLIIVLIVLIKNTNPRLRIDQAVKFFWEIMTLLAIIAIFLAFLGY